MRRRRPIGGSLLPVLLLGLALAAEPRAGLTFCIAADGHAAVELAHAAAPCTRDARRHHGETGRLDARDLSRHPCRDVPLLRADAALAPSAEVSIAAAPAPMATLAFVARPPAPRPGPRRATERARAPDASVALRTVVLLV